MAGIVIFSVIVLMSCAVYLVDREEKEEKEKKSLEEQNELN